MRKSKRNLEIIGQNRLSAISVFVLSALLTSTVLHAAPVRGQSQTQSATAPKLEYEVATIKPNKSAIPPAVMTTDDGIDIRNIPLGILLGVAFGVSNDRIAGGPEWLSDRYDVSAKFEPDVADALKKLNPLDRRAARQRMLQALLSDRFKIAYHRDTKELPVFLLVVAKGGPKLPEGKPADASPEGVGGTGTLAFGQGGLMTFKAMPLSSLVLVLSQQVGRTVLDKTGLTGRYDFTWQFGLTANPGAGRGGGPAAGAPGGANPSTSSDSEPDFDFHSSSGRARFEIGLRQRPRRNHCDRPHGTAVGKLEGPEHNP